MSNTNEILEVAIVRAWASDMVHFAKVAMGRKLVVDIFFGDGRPVHHELVVLSPNECEWVGRWNNMPITSKSFDRALADELSMRSHDPLGEMKARVVYGWVGAETTMEALIEINDWKMGPLRGVNVDVTYIRHKTHQGRTFRQIVFY